MKETLEKLARVEDELSELRRRTRRLSDTVVALKKEVAERVSGDSPARSTMPPLPTPVPEVARASERRDSKPTPKPADSEIVPEPARGPSPSRVSDPVLESTSDPSSDFREDPSPRDLEMHLGRVWSVRLGIVLLTTGFVFLGSYTYDAVIRDLGPGLRLTLMYLLSFLLTGVGLVCERWKESLQSYGRIVAAGGLAAIYYCGFAAHNVEALRVIESPVVASLVLLVSAGLFSGMSLWRNSRVMLSASLALAFYSVSVNPIGWMACLSALVLASFGIAMMIRHRWIEVGFLVLVGSYLSYFGWQFAVYGGESALSHWFLPAYWLLFTAAALVPGRLTDPNKHLLFTGLNNSAFFFLFSFRPGMGTWMEQHWLFCLVFGSVLILLSLLTRNHFPAKSRHVHLVKGLGVVTLGLALLLDGPQLFVAFLLEALVLMAVSVRFPNPLTKAASWGAGLLSCLVLTEVTVAEVPSGFWLFGALAWILLGTLHRRIEIPPGKMEFHPGASAASLISLLLLALGWTSTWSDWDRALTFGTLGLLASGLSLAGPVQRKVPETLGVFLIGGLLALFSTVSLPPTGLTPVLVAVLLAFLSSLPPAVICRRMGAKEGGELFHLVAGAFLAISLPLAWLAILQTDLPAMARLVIVLGIPIVGTLGASRTGLLAHSAVPFAMHFALFEIGEFSTTACLIAFLITGGHFLLLHRLNRLPDREVLKTSVFLLAGLFWGLFLIQGLDSPGLPLAWSGLALFLLMPFLGRILTAVVAVPYFVLGTGLAIFLGHSSEVYLGILPLLALHLVRSFQNREDTLTLLTVPTLLVLWGQLTHDAGNAPLAAVWALTGTALLLIGLGFKSRPFRLIGLIALAFSLGYLMLFEVMKFDPLPRILSFMTLGLGLLGLGFVYNRYQDRLKQML